MSSELLVLSDIAAPIKNAIVGGPFGSNLVSKDYVEHGVPVIRGQNMGDKWVSGEFVYVSEEKAQALSQNSARPGDLVFTQRGTLGQVSIVPRGRFDKYIVSQSQMKITVDPDKADVTFLYYLFKTPEQLQYIFNSAIQTGVPHTNLGILKATPVQLPPLSVQRQISAVMNCLDDRIALLRETNATLEAIAQALFKSWFVDFDPVHAKMNGRTPEGMDEATAALFPDSLEESELGLVPQGWRGCVVSDVTKQIFSGGTPDTRKPEYWFGELPWFSSGETRQRVIVDTEKKINSDAVKNSSTKLALPGDILIASAGQGHTRGQTSYCSIKTYINQSVISVRADREKCDSLWLFYNLSRRYAEMRDLSDSHSSRGSLTTKLLAGMRVVLPEFSLLQKFGNVTSVLMESQANNLVRVATLSRIRDTLLPRLISGQLRLPAAEAMVESVL